MTFKWLYGYMRVLCVMVRAGQAEEVKVQFCPRDWKAYETKVPVYLGGDKTKPYMNLEVSV